MKLSKNDVAEILRLPVSTIERWIRQGSIPYNKSGGECVFYSDKIEAWAKSKRLAIHGKNDAPARPPAVEDLRVAGCMEKGGFFYGLRCADAVSAITQACERLPFGEEARLEILEALIAREKLASTGVGKGVAIPHPRTPQERHVTEPMIVTCFLEEPVDFSSVDELPVSVVFLLLSPDLKTHLKALSMLARLLGDDSFVSFLKTAPRGEALLEEVARREAGND